MLFLSPSRGRFFTRGAVDFLCDRLARREEECFALDERFLAREKRVVSLEADEEFLTQENCLLKNATFKLKLDLSSQISEVFFFQSRVSASEPLSTVTPVELQSLTIKRDRY